MSQRFLRCVHCGLPHAVDETVCPITGRPVERRARAAPPPSQRNPQPYASPSYAPPSYSPPAPERASSGRERVADRASEKLRAAPFAELDAQPHPLIGQVLGGKYRAIRVLGEGGMGTVYECEHVAIHRRVAVKVLNAAQARKKASLARFQNEAHVAGAIGHPNICEIYDMGELDDNSPFLVMELLTGETLADRIASEGALPFDDIVDIISQVLSGLVAAHEKSVIHRDIKPENVFLTQRPGLPPMIKLLDFGISKMGGGEELHLTRTGMVMGTPYYMSPEQARGDRKLDHRVDIYATGVMTYECLTGRRPFIAANYNALLVQILTGSPRPLHDLRPAVSDGFADFVSKAMHRDRNHRFQDAAEMQRELVNLRDPANARRIASVPPEPVPLVRNKRSPDDSAPKPPKPLAPQIPSPPKLPSDELASISVDIDTNLLDSGLGKPESAISEQTAESTSVEIPVHVDAPAPRSPREVTAQERATVLAAARASALPPAPASPPRPIPAPPPIPAAAHRPSTPLMPGPLMPGPHRPTPMPGMAPVGSRELQRPPAREPPPIPRHSPGVPLTARSAGAPARASRSRARAACRAPRSRRPRSRRPWVRRPAPRPIPTRRVSSDATSPSEGSPTRRPTSTWTSKIRTTIRPRSGSFRTQECTGGATRRSTPTRPSASPLNASRACTPSSPRGRHVPPRPQAVCVRPATSRRRIAAPSTRTAIPTVMHRPRSSIVARSRWASRRARTPPLPRARVRPARAPCRRRAIRPFPACRRCTTATGPSASRGTRPSTRARVASPSCSEGSPDAGVLPGPCSRPTAGSPPERWR